MSPRVFTSLAVALGAVAAAFAIGFAQQSGTALAEGHNCPAGTNWDNKIQGCR